MASEPRTTDRDAAVRQLLVERVHADVAPDARRPGRDEHRRRHPEPGRLRLALVTGVVSAAVVAVSLAALNLPHGRGDAATDAHPSSSASPPPVSESPAPAPSSTAPLIAHAGWHVLTRAQLHAFVVASPTLQDDPANAAIWEEQAWLDIRCMASHGYLYDPIAQQQDDLRRGPADPVGTGLTAKQLQGYDTALWGPPSDAPYDWRTAGCHGRSVHETGQDHAN